MVDRQTFDRLMLDHLQGALRFAIRLSGSATVGEELVQEALVRAAAARERFRGESSFRTWLFQIVVNVFRDELRSRPRRANPMPEDVADHRSADPPVHAAAAELAERVAVLVSSLPPRQREVIVLVAYERLTTTEAAAMLGITEQNARTNLSLARTELKRQLAPYFGNERAPR
ncbi:MAG TPA: RNA polymerase sigma factor [Tepidisphaeraceae bacterium]|nr:RNA polymerase sigma factor [Tepidisphaeraceae bacterium]